MCSERKQKEVGHVVAQKLDVDVVAGEEVSEERDGLTDNVDGYKWFGKPRTNQTSLRGEAGVGFLVRECPVDEVVRLGMTGVCGRRFVGEREGSIMRTDSKSVSVFL